tara:strand:- start:463 stop:792 length:330 start_codon:yes stop_codon:yes gene_type:complete
MKITKRQLRRIIAEEVAGEAEMEAAIDEEGADEGGEGKEAPAEDDVAASKAELKKLLLQLSKKTTELKLSKKEVAIISKTIKGLMNAADARDLAGKAQPFLNALGKLVG